MFVLKYWHVWWRDTGMDTNTCSGDINKMEVRYLPMFSCPIYSLQLFSSSKVEKERNNISCILNIFVFFYPISSHFSYPKNSLNNFTECTVDALVELRWLSIRSHHKPPFAVPTRHEFHRTDLLSCWIRLYIDETCIRVLHFLCFRPTYPGAAILCCAESTVCPTLKPLESRKWRRVSISREKPGTMFSHRTQKGVSRYWNCVW